MKSHPSAVVSGADPTIAPVSVRVLRTLGHGRAARAQLVEAVMPGGRTMTCVEKVFAPRWLTRTIYRISFQSPFAYQSNRDAILACFYRRRVAAAVISGSDVKASIASPMYVRFEESERAWVLAAEWIQGRGIRPAAADATRIRRWLAGPSRSAQSPPASRQEVDELLATMHRLEALLGDCGLTGSGWQVAPRAVVSTANLLRTGDQYTIIDLESGIPAVLVPRYLASGLRRAALPPFDELDADKLYAWIDRNERMLLFRIGRARLEQLRCDSQRLTEHWTRWKDSELALFRRPWRLLARGGMAAYQRECLRRWRQDDVIDAETFERLAARSAGPRWIWYAGLLPSAVGRLCSRLLGRSDCRDRFVECLHNGESRADEWRRLVGRCQSRWSAAGRLAPHTQLTLISLVPHLLLKLLTPVALHRFLSDADRRRAVVTGLLLLMLSPRYQAWFGQNRIEASIDRWERSERISSREADELRKDLHGHEVRVYTRGFGMHLALKALAPLIVPAKVGGVAAFVASGHLWFLLPMLATPLLRTAVTLGNWWTSRHQHIPHGEALLTGWLPVVGSIAFPLQMFTTRPQLSTFLVRDAASKLGQQFPVYGGADSLTEIALIRATDLLVEFMQTVSALTQRIPLWQAAARPRRSARQLPAPSRWSRWIDQQAIHWILAAGAVDDDRLAASRDAKAA